MAPSMIDTYVYGAIYLIILKIHAGPHSPQTATLPGSAESSLHVPQSSQQVADVSSDTGQIQGQLQRLHGWLLVFLYVSCVLCV